jgi:mannosyltransferase OCH1-like enzyme
MSVGQIRIPKKITHIWIGHKEPPYEWMNTWKKKHPSWDYTIFDNEKFNSRTFINQHLIDEYMSRNIYAGVADLIRYELLYEEGGFLPPADAVCLENTNELWIEDEDYCYTVYENEIIKERKGAVSPIYACNPKNEFVWEIIQRLNKLTPKELDDKPYRSTGNDFLKYFIEEKKPKIKIFPWYNFIPQWVSWGDEFRYNGPGKIYADQMWYSTNRGNKIQ